MNIICPALIKAQIPALLWDIEQERVAILAGHANDGTVHIAAILEAENMHHDPHNHFALKSAQWKRLKREAERKGLQIVGLVHSHPEGHPAEASSQDLAIAKRWRAVIVGAVFHSLTGQLIWYNGDGEISREALRLPVKMRIVNRLIGFDD